MTSGPDITVKQVIGVFLAALFFYISAFSWIEHRRVAKGPWEMDFISDAAGRPSLRISQPALRLSAKLSFPDNQAGRSNLFETVRFSAAITNLPFGEMLFQDPLYLPGTVTMRLFGHQVEVIPRTLIIDHLERGWGSGAEIVVRGGK